MPVLPGRNSPDGVSSPLITSCWPVRLYGCGVTASLSKVGIGDCAKALLATNRHTAASPTVFFITITPQKIYK